MPQEISKSTVSQNNYFEPLPIIAQQYPRVVTPLLKNADISIRVIVYDWRLYPTISGSAVSQFNSAIREAVNRGVSVRALVNNDGVIKWLKENGADARRFHSKRKLHTKLLIIDDQQVVIGSHNFTQNAFSMNEEASVLVHCSDKQNDFVRYFEALWGV